MSTLFNKFAELPVLVDDRLLPYNNVIAATESLKGAIGLTTRETLALLGTIDYEILLHAYSKEVRSVRNNYSRLRMNIENSSFNHFKQLIGDDDYV